MTMTTTTRSTDLERPAHRPPARGFVTAAGGVVTALVAGFVAGFVALLAFPATASARVIDAYQPGTGPTTAAEPVPGAGASVPPESSGWSLTTVVSLAVIVAVVLGVGLVVGRAAHRRHDGSTPALAR